jgi:hypothetical protein
LHYADQINNKLRAMRLGELRRRISATSVRAKSSPRLSHLAFDVDHSGSAATAAIAAARAADLAPVLFAELRAAGATSLRAIAAG